MTGDRSGTEKQLNHYIQQIMGVSLNETDDASEPDFRSSTLDGFSVARGVRLFAGDRERYCVNTVLNVSEKQRGNSFALRARDDVQEESSVDVGISRAVGQKMLHATSLVVEDAFETPVWLEVGGDAYQLPARRWIDSASSILASRVNYSRDDADLLCGQSLLNFNLLVPRGNVRYVHRGLPVWTLTRHFRKELEPPLGEVLRRAPHYVGSATAGPTCRAGVIAEPGGCRLVITNARGGAQEMYVPFPGSSSGMPWGYSDEKHTVKLQDLSSSLRIVLREALRKWLWQSDYAGPPDWQLLWVEPSPCSELLSCLEPAVQWPPPKPYMTLAVKAQVLLSPEALPEHAVEALRAIGKAPSLDADEEGNKVPHSPGPDEGAPAGRRIDRSSSRRLKSAKEDYDSVKSIRQQAWSEHPEPDENAFDMTLVDEDKKRKQVMEFQESVAEELAQVMDIESKDISVQSIHGDEFGNWVIEFSAKATRNELVGAMVTKNAEEQAATMSPAARIKQLAEEVRVGSLKHQEDLPTVRYAIVGSMLHEIERLQISDVHAWRRAKYGDRITPEMFERTSQAYNSTDDLFRSAFSGTGLSEADMLKLQKAGITEDELRSHGLMWMGLTDEERTRLSELGLSGEELRSRLMHCGEPLTEEELDRLRSVDISQDRLQQALVGLGSFSEEERSRLESIGLPEVELRRRVNEDDGFSLEEIRRLESIDLPLEEVTSRTLYGISRGRQNLLEDILARLADDEDFTPEELLRFARAGISISELQRRVNAVSMLTDGQNRRLTELGLTEEEIHRRFISGEGFSAEELAMLAKAGIPVEALKRQMLGIFTPEEVARLRSIGTSEKELRRGLLKNVSFADDELTRLESIDLPIREIRRRFLQQSLQFSETEIARLASIGFTPDEILRRLMEGEGFSEEELARLASIGLPLELLMSRGFGAASLTAEQRARLEAFGLSEVEIYRRLMNGEGFTEEELALLASMGLSVEDLRRRVLGTAQSEAEYRKLLAAGDDGMDSQIGSSSQPGDGEALADELITLLGERYQSDESWETAHRLQLAIENLRGVARICAEDSSEAHLCDFAEAIAEMILVDASPALIKEAEDLLQLLRVDHLVHFLEKAVVLKDVNELSTMIYAIESKASDAGLLDFEAAMSAIQFGSSGLGDTMLLGFYQVSLDGMRTAGGLFNRCHQRLDFLKAEAKLEEMLDRLDGETLDKQEHLTFHSTKLQKLTSHVRACGGSEDLVYQAEAKLQWMAQRGSLIDTLVTCRQRAFDQMRSNLNFLKQTGEETMSMKHLIAQNLDANWESSNASNAGQASIPIDEQTDRTLEELMEKQLPDFARAISQYIEEGLPGHENFQAEADLIAELMQSMEVVNDMLQEKTPRDVFDLYGRIKKLQGPVSKLKEDFARAQGAGVIAGLESAVEETIEQVHAIQSSWTSMAAEAVPKVLHQAISHGYDDLVELCFAVSSDPAALLTAVQDRDGGNAIHVATASGHPAMIEVLMQYGCDPHARNSKERTSVDVAIEAWHRADLAGGDPEAIERWKKCIEVLFVEQKVKSMEYVYYKKRDIWMRRPTVLLKWLNIQKLFQEQFGANMNEAFGEIDTNHSGGIVKYEWMAMFDAEGPGHRALLAAGMESKEIFDLLDALDEDGKDMMIRESAFDLLSELDWHLSSEVWQDMLLKPLLVKRNRRASV